MILSIVANGLAAAGVALAALVLWRVARPRALRWLAAALGAYGVVSLVYAARTGTPLRAVLGGDALFFAVPRVLQGAFLGGVLVLPLGWLVAVVRAGIPRLRRDSPRAAIYQAVALTLCLALVVVSFPASGARSSNARGGGPLTPAERAEQLARSLRAIEDGERESPRDRWDPDYVVSMVGRDPQRLFEWVRDNTYWIPYRGTLRGPVGVLMDRQGNSLDRALLLATLLEKAGRTVRLAHGQLSPAYVTALLPDLVLRRALAFEVIAPSPPVPELKEVAASYQLDHEAMQDRVAAIAAAANQTLTELDQRVDDQAARLTAMVDRPRSSSDWTVNVMSSRDALADHWWVQQQDAGSWADWDLLEETGTGHPALVEPTATISADSLPPDQVHQLTVRVVTERWAGGVPQESKILEHRLRTADMAGQPAVLQFWPGSWPTEVARDADGPHGMKAAALEQTEWAAMLQVGGRPATQAVITEAGPAVAKPETSNPFGGLAGSFSATISHGGVQPAAKSVLTAAWIEYEIQVPGRPTRAIRRVVFDLVGPAKRGAGQGPVLPLDDAQRLARSLSLMMRTEILPVNCALAPDFVSHLSSESLRKNAPLLRALALEDLSRNQQATQKVLAEATPPVSPLVTLALLRSTWGRSAHHVFLSELNVLTRHRTPVAVPHGVALQEATDIVANGLGVDLAESNPFAVRLERGVFDTNAEAVLGAGPDVENAANAFANSKAWDVMTAERRSALERAALPNDVKRRIGDDLDQGFVIVVPNGSRGSAAGKFAGWWRIDPKTGDALGMDSQGWGASLFERGALTDLAVVFAKAFIFEDGLCMGFPQAVNALVALKEVVTEKAFGFRMVKPYDPSDLYDKTYNGCMISAIVAGFAATLPLLLMTLRARGRSVRIGPGTPKQPEPPQGPKPSVKPGEAPPVEPQPPARCEAEGNVAPKTSSSSPESPGPEPQPVESAPAGDGSQLGRSNPFAVRFGPDTGQAEYYTAWLKEPVRPADYSQLLENYNAARARTETALQQAQDRYAAVAERYGEAEARASALKAQYYEEVNAGRPNSPLAQDLNKRALDAATDVVDVGGQIDAAVKEVGLATRERNFMTNEDSKWRNLENANRRWYDARERYRRADAAFDQYRRSHPDRVCDDVWMAKLHEAGQAEISLDQARREFQELELSTPRTGRYWGAKTQQLPSETPDTASPPQPVRLAQSGNTLPLLPSPGAQSPGTPLPQTPGAQSGQTLPLLPTPQTRALAGQLGVADALSTAK